MSPSRKVGVVGIFVGSASLFAAIVTLAIPLLLARAAFSHSSHFVLRHQILQGSIISWVIGAPVAFVFGAFGTLVFILSLAIYLDTKRKDRTLI